MIKLLKIVAPLWSIILLVGCAGQKTSNLPYTKTSGASAKSVRELNVFQPRKSTKKPVVIFIHGGDWEHGKKEIYSFLGRNFAKKGIVTVIPNYTLSPDGNYNDMAKDVAAAIKWTHDNIAKYGGDPGQIYLMGHSAGGHLIALVGTNPKYIKDVSMIKGIILNDAAGLDMYSYLKENPPTSESHYDVTWTTDEANWKDASPVYFLSEKAPPFFIYLGTKSYPSIITGNKTFIKELNKYQAAVEIKYLRKKHVPMMSQLISSRNKRYKEIINFIHLHK